MDVETAGRAECPKRMHYGPCGGVSFDGSCEVSPEPCAFVDLPTVPWTGASPSAASRPAGAAMRALIDRRPIVVGDLPARALNADSLRACAAVVRGSLDAVLLGDAPRARVQFPPAYRAHLVSAAGLAAWAGLNCRDRNRVALEGELAGLAEVGVAGVHCVTGDHTLSGHRPEAAPVFDLDATRLAALAREAGHLVSVAESPATPPVERRAERLAVKVAAGAEVCFVNHAGGAEPVRRFLAECRALGLDVAFVACVPLVVDIGSAALLRSFAGLVTPEGYLDQILAAEDAHAAGVRAAVELSLALLEVPGVRGINLSGGPTAGEEVAYAEALAEVSTRLGLTH